MAESILPFGDKEPIPKNMRESMCKMDATVQELEQLAEATKHAVDALLRTPDRSTSVESIRTLLVFLADQTHASMNFVNSEAERYGANHKELSHA